MGFLWILFVEDSCGGTRNFYLFIYSEARYARELIDRGFRNNKQVGAGYSLQTLLYTISGHIDIVKHIIVYIIVLQAWTCFG